MKNVEYARIHRFHNQVSVHLDSSSVTTYLTPAFARKLAKELIRFADNIDKNSHWLSTRIVEHLDNLPNPTGKAKAYNECDEKSRPFYWD